MLAALFLESWLVSAVDPLGFFLYSVFNKRVLKALLPSDVVFQVSHLSGSTFLSQVCPGPNGLMWRQRNPEQVNHASPPAFSLSRHTAHASFPV